MVYAWLVVAALFEVGGDGAMRAGLRGSPWGYVLGGVCLVAYGLLVNRPALAFGRALGLYIAVFFLVSQALAWLAWGERPDPGLLAGGALIVGGGLVIHLTAR